MTRTANPVITVTASATQHSSGCIALCPASFMPVTVTDRHSTKFSPLSHISPQHLTVSERLLNSIYDSFIGIMGFRTVKF